MLSLEEYGDLLIKLIKENNLEIKKNKGEINIHVFTKILDYIEEFTVMCLEKNSVVVKADDLNAKLLEIMDAFQNQDYILVSDLFEYEIIDILRRNF